MLNNAKRNAEIADAATKAKKKANLAKYATVADKAIPMVRKMFENEVNRRAEKGNRSYRLVLGIHRGDYVHYGILYEALESLDPGIGKDISKMSTWGEGIRRAFPESTVREYIWNLWDAMCLDLLDELEECGYEIVVEPKNYSEVLDTRNGKKLEPSPEILGDHFIQVKW